MGEEQTKGAGGSAPISFGGTARKIWAMTESGPSWAKAPLGVIAAAVIAVASAVAAVVNLVWAVLVWPVNQLRSRRGAVEEIGSPMHGVKHREV